MDREIVSRLIYSIVQFLRNQLEIRSNLSEEGAESVEVALQCLETAYGISSDSDLSVSRSLYNIFSEAVQDEVNVSSRAYNFGSSVPNDLDRDEAERLKNEGNALMREEQFDQAIDCYTKAIALDRTNAVYFCNRAAAYTKVNKHNDAIEDCKSALDIEPQYSKAYGRMGLAYSALENARKAKECYKKALELEPDNESYRSNLQIAEEKLRSQQSEPQNSFNPFAGLGGGGGAGFNLGALGNMAGLGSGGPPDIQGLFSNPGLMNMATQLMQDPNIQNMMTSFLGNMGSGSSAAPSRGSGSSSTPPEGGSSAGSPSAGGGSMEALLTAGRQLAEQMQAQHPDLVEQLRSNLNRPGDGSGNSGPQDPPPS